MASTYWPRCTEIMPLLASPCARRLAARSLVGRLGRRTLDGLEHAVRRLLVSPTATHRLLPAVFLALPPPFTATVVHAASHTAIHELGTSNARFMPLQPQDATRRVAARAFFHTTIQETLYAWKQTCHRVARGVIGRHAVRSTIPAFFSALPSFRTHCRRPGQFGVTTWQLAEDSAHELELRPARGGLQCMHYTKSHSPSAPPNIASYVPAESDTMRPQESALRSLAVYTWNLRGRGGGHAARDAVTIVSHSAQEYDAHSRRPPCLRRALERPDSSWPYDRASSRSPFDIEHKILATCR